VSFAAYVMTPRATYAQEGMIPARYEGSLLPEFEPVDPGTIARIAAVARDPSRLTESTIVIQARTAESLTPQSVCDALGGGGWIVSASKSGWFDARHPSAGKRLRLHIPQLAESGRDPLLAGTGLGHEHAAFALWSWHAALGTAYVHNPGVSAIINLRETASRGKPPRWILRHPATTELWRPPYNLTDIRWTARTKQPAKLARWDMRSAYLAAAAAAMLPYRQLTRTGADPGVATGPVGYYRVRAHADDSAGTRALALLPKDHQGCYWVGREIVMSGWANFEIIDSWTTPDSGRILRPWAERWRDLIATPVAVPPTFRPALKMGYTAALGGLLTTPSGSVYRPDWRHLIIDQLRASMIRRIHNAYTETGLWPWRVDVDSVWYDANKETPQLAAALGEGPRVGNMRREDDE
jgi:hypothetical protein